VRPLGSAFAFDLDADRAERYAEDMSRELGIGVSAVSDLGSATLHSDVIITCTPARRWFLGREHVSPGTFVAAVGADNPVKQEIEPELLAACTVVCDDVAQCATIGDLHHALDAGVMRREDVVAELAGIVAGRQRARRSEDEIIVFDSTGTALQDAASAILVYDRALASGAGLAISLGAAVGAPAP
jgi:ornithine cyclodeaminase/alanine dehydrogenase-like protein (mu-crystallin family)